MQTSTATTPSHSNPPQSNPWGWVPTLYFAQAIPYVVVMSLSVIMYKDMGISNSDIAFYTSLLYLPWVIKPLWSPIVDMFGTKRRWTVLFTLVSVVTPLSESTRFICTREKNARARTSGLENSTPGRCLPGDVRHGRPRRGVCRSKQP